MEPILFSPTLAAIPAFLLLIALELFVFARRGKNLPAIGYARTDTATSLLLGIGSVLAGTLGAGAVLALSLWVYQFRLSDFGYVWWAWPIAFIAYDLVYYVKHRAAHRIRWFWADHVVHHSSEHYNLSTALRQPWTGMLALYFVFSLPLFLIGFPPAMIIFCAGLNLVYQFWIHTEAIARMPRWFETVMNTPSHHRVHHAVNPRYLDSNYAGTFIVWDRLFGTFVAETGEEKIRYGIVTPLGSYNPLRAAFHEWIGIARDGWRAPGVRNKLGYLFGPPGWSHDGSRDTSDTIKARWRASQRQDNAAEPGGQEYKVAR